MFPLLLFALQLTSADAMYREGVRLLESGKPAEGIPHLERAVALAPANPQYWKVLGVAFAVQKDYAGALPGLSKACELAPALTDACYFYGRALYALDRYDPALVALDRALEHAGNKPRSRLGRAQVMEALGHAEEAEDDYRESLTEEDSRLYYGQFLFRAGRLDEALQILQVAKQTQSVHYQLGRVLYQMGKLEEAVKHLSAAPSLSEAKLLLDKAQRRLGSSTSK